LGHKIERPASAGFSVFGSQFSRGNQLVGLRATTQAVLSNLVGFLA
jgi:hypothetical protein